MPENTLNYSKILEYFGEETVGDRYRFLHDKMQKYIDERSQGGKLEINEGILQQTIMDYFTDIYRLKEFHKIENEAKIVAYQIHWLLRRKPIQVRIIEQNPLEPNSKLVFANEGFCTTLIANEFLMPEETSPLAPEKENALLTFLGHLYYHLKYRSVDKQSLETVLYAFEVGKQCS